jgi:hypothetical protein
MNILTKVLVNLKEILKYLSIFGMEKRIFSTLKLPDRLLDLIFKGYTAIFSGIERSGREATGLRVSRGLLLLLIITLWSA